MEKSLETTVQIDNETRSYFPAWLTRIRSNTTVMIGIVILIIAILVAIFGPFIVEGDPLKTVDIKEFDPGEWKNDDNGALDLVANTAELIAGQGIGVGNPLGFAGGEVKKPNSAGVVFSFEVHASLGDREIAAEV